MSELDTINPTEEASPNMKYIGADIDINTYWSNCYDWVAILRQNGKLVKFVQYSDNKSNATPTVSPAGDIYFMKHEKEKMSLYRIKRQW